MFTRKPPKKSTVDELIDDLRDSMIEAGPHSDEYSKMLDQLTKLYKLKEVDLPKQISPDTVLLVAGNLVGIVLILGYERANVLTSRAVNFVMKLR